MSTQLTEFYTSVQKYLYLSTNSCKSAKKQVISYKENLIFDTRIMYVVFNIKIYVFSQGVGHNDHAVACCNKSKVNFRLYGSSLIGETPPKNIRCPEKIIKQVSVNVPRMGSDSAILFVSSVYALTLNNICSGG